MPSYKLTYFDYRARAETARMLFKLGDQAYEDVRVSDDWPKLKPTLPMGQLPVLEVDGTMLSQSNAINRYLAKLFGYAGKTELEQAQVDMFVDCVEDACRTEPIYAAKTDEEKKKAKDFYRTEVLIPALGKIQALLQKNGDGFAVGEGLTWADLSLVNMEEYYLAMADMSGLADFPALQAHRARVEEQPKIAAWIQERPHNAM